MKWLFIFIGLLFTAYLTAQDGLSLGWDIDSIFDEPLPESSPNFSQEEAETGSLPIGSLIQQRGIFFEAAYEFNLGIAPGWRTPPWYSGKNEEDPHVERFMNMKGSFTIDAQISEVFRTRSTVNYEIPKFQPGLGDFFFDYKVYDVVFFRGGKYNISWGISPNYGYTNLLSRVPDEKYIYDPFILKADVPVGKGGFQALTLTRIDLIYDPKLPKWEDFAIGGKYNLALPQVDLDTGFFYQEGMDLRFFLSLKTTLWKTEFYGEGLVAVDVDKPTNISGAGSFGFGRDFFDDRFNVNGELFYNAERKTYLYHPETNIREARTSEFIEDLNLALNLLCKPWDIGNPRLILRTLYAPMQHSAQFIPGFRLSPLKHLEFYLATPMSLGNKNGYYYKNTPTVVDNETSLPFAVIFMITLKGSIQFGRHF